MLEGRLKKARTCSLLALGSWGLASIIAGSLPQAHFAQAAEVSAPVVNQVLPRPNKLPLTPENFCLGAQETLKKAMQNLTEQLAAVCGANGVPTQLFQNLLATPYTGTGNVTLRRVRAPVENQNDQTTELFVAYAMRVPKSAVNTLLYEEKHATVGYDSDAQPLPTNGDQQARMRMSFSFQEPPKNVGDADTTFGLQQTVDVRSLVVNFNDVSQHDLRQYILHKDNFDFFMAGRTLLAPTQQFKKSTVLRGFMTDPANAERAYVITIAHFLMNSRQQHDQLVLAFTNFLTTDVAKLYAAQSR